VQRRGWISFEYWHGGGTDPKILLRLYKVYIRSIFEYGSISFLHCPESSLNILQKIQNRAIRICLRLPSYISIKLLHESACLPTVRERLIQQGTSLLARMRQSNPLIYDLIHKRERLILKNILEGRIGVDWSHRSPLDIILPAQWPFLPSIQTRELLLLKKITC